MENPDFETKKELISNPKYEGEDVYLLHTWTEQGSLTKKQIVELLKIILKN